MKWEDFYRFLSLQTELLSSINVAATVGSSPLASLPITKLFDGKIFETENDGLWTNGGDGTRIYTSGKVDLTVAPGQFLISQSRAAPPYFAGNREIIEATCYNFHSETGVTKRIGYFTSSFVSPYDADLDGFFIEDDGTGKTFQCWNGGTQVFSTPIGHWDNYEDWKDYDFQNFTAFLWSFLWLGGVELNLSGSQGDLGFVPCHKSKWAGTQPGTLTRSPNLHLRYEIRSTGGSGTLTRVCSTVGTLGTVSETGRAIAAYNPTAITTNNKDTSYVLLGIRQRADRMNIPVKVMSMGGGFAGSTDAGLLSFHRNPTLSAPLVYADNSDFQQAIATGQVITDPGRVLHAQFVNRSGYESRFDNEYLSWLSHSIDGSPDEFVLSMRPATNNSKTVGVLNLKEF